MRRRVGEEKETRGVPTEVSAGIVQTIHGEESVWTPATL